MSFFSEYMDFVNDLIMGGKIYRDDRINEIFKSNSIQTLLISGAIAALILNFSSITNEIPSPQNIFLICILVLSISSKIIRLYLH